MINMKSLEQDTLTTGTGDESTNISISNTSNGRGEGIKTITNFVNIRYWWNDDIEDAEEDTYESEITAAEDDGGIMVDGNGMKRIQKIKKMIVNFYEY